MIIDLDIGNTFTKWRLVRNGEVVERGQLATAACWEVQADFPALAQVTSMRVSNVAGQGKEAEIAALAERYGVRLYIARTTASFDGVRCAYRQPETMGVDRWLGVIAAHHKTDGGCCVVDCGSAITIDFIERNGRHLGGYIVPGIRLMKESLKLGTKAVPVDEQVWLDGLREPGRSTYEAVNHGVFLMACSMIERAYQRFTAGAPETAELLISGGDAPALINGLQVTARHQPDLVFEGLELMFPL